MPRIMAGAKYGALLGVLIAVMSVWNSSIAWASFCAIQTILLAIYTKLTWQRTGMFWMTVGGADATLTAAALMLASLAGYPVGNMRNMPASWMLILGINAAVLILTQALSGLLERDRYRRWKQHMEPVSLRDMLLFRHIPHLR
jgi:hypothetical protein